MHDFLDVILSLLYTCVILCLAALIIGASVMWLWNAVIPAIFGLSKITFGQALGLSLLSNILLGGISMHSSK